MKVDVLLTDAGVYQQPTFVVCYTNLVFMSSLLSIVPLFLYSYIIVITKTSQMSIKRERGIFWMGSFINNVTQIWTIFDPLPQLLHFLVLSFLNSLSLRAWRHLWTTPYELLFRSCFWRIPLSFQFLIKPGSMNNIIFQQQMMTSKKFWKFKFLNKFRFGLI